MQKDLKEYLQNLSKKLSKRKIIKKDFEDLLYFPLAIGQSFYVLDYSKQEITHSKGILKMLGYSKKEFTYHKLLSIFHPDDKEMMARLVKATLEFASENIVTNEVGFFVTYRLRKKDGTYIKVLRQSNIYEHDSFGRIISNISLLSDISFLGCSDRVLWKFDAPGLDQLKFKKYIGKQYVGYFSEREIEILQFLKDGKTSKVISKELYLSKHTIDVHRRNMLKKSKCKKTIDLVTFSIINGII